MSDSREIRVRVPASSANLGPGFDTLAVALGLYLRCTLRRSSGGLKITSSGTDTGEIAADKSNLIYRAFCRLAEKGAGDVEIEIQNEIPLGRGLGSSAAAIVAGLALANEWAGLKRTREQLVELATEMEGHPDNVAAAVLGGFVTSCEGQGGVISLKSAFPSGIEVVVVVPQFRLSTEAARAALPEQYSRRDAVFNVQRAALLVGALRDGRSDLIAEAMQDRIHQPYRAGLVPGFEEALALSGVPGLLGVALSGAGPSIVAFCDSNAAGVGEAIAGCFRKHSIQAQALRLPVDQQGLVAEGNIVSAPKV